jgi:aspartate/methionine/tyrosine aminotransferase
MSSRTEDHAGITTAHQETTLAAMGLQSDDFGIEEYLATVNDIERRTGIEFVRLDFGIPGLTPLPACVSGHTAPLQSGCIPQQYPPAAGVERLRAECASFVSWRIGIDCPAGNVFVTCGGTQALYVAQTIAAHLTPGRRAAVLLTPTYPPMFAQARLLGLEVRSVELDQLHGAQLCAAIEEQFKAGDVACLCWASPNNPTWSARTSAELKAIAALCARYDVIPIEDLTYLGMTGRSGGKADYFPSIARYADRSFIVLSASKMLSYAGERVGFLIGGQALLASQSSALAAASGLPSVARTCSSMIFNLTGGAPHSAQHGVALALEAINQGKVDLEQLLSVYAQRARRLKQILSDNGFYLVYADEAQRAGDGFAGDGFYVCFGYPGMSGADLLRRLLVYGVTVLPLRLFGSTRIDAVRACVGRLDEQAMALLVKRLDGFWAMPENTPLQPVGRAQQPLLA